MAKKKNFDTELNTLLLINLAVLVLLLSFFNILSLKKRHIEVLGAETDSTFWQDFTTKYPTYRDGWVELGRMDKVKDIDPNFKP